MKTRNVYYGAVPNPYSGEQRPDGSFEAKIEQCPEQRCTKASCSWCLLVYNNPGIFSVFWFYSAWVSGPCEVWRFHDFKKMSWVDCFLGAPHIAQQAASKPFSAGATLVGKPVWTDRQLESHEQETQVEETLTVPAPPTPEAPTVGSLPLFPEPVPSQSPIAAPAAASPPAHLPEPAAITSVSPAAHLPQPAAATSMPPPAHLPEPAPDALHSATLPKQAPSTLTSMPAPATLPAKLMPAAAIPHDTQCSSRSSHT